jgi:UDP-N-acetylglucosamine:LPS N-acetylglucosamine transferase
MRASAILRHLRSEATVLSSLPSGVDGAALVPLPMDTGPLISKAAAGVPVHRSLHYAPIGCPGLTERMATIASWAVLWRPDLILVDVSVEVAVFARLCGLPVVIVRQHGERNDPAHLLAYESAVSLLAPYPESFEEPSTPEWVKRRTMYVGGFSRFDNRSLPEPRTAVPEGKRSVVVFAGGGGPGADLDLVAAAATATPGWCWSVIGPASGNAHQLVRHSPWVGDPYPHLADADVVVTAAGDNAVAEVAAAGRPLISIPEQRPFNEQRSKAAVLRRAEAAVVLPEWPEPDGWPDLLDTALKLGASGLKTLVDGRGAARAAARLDELALEFSPANQ